MNAAEFMIDWKRMCQSLKSCERCMVKAECVSIKSRKFELLDVIRLFNYVKNWAKENPRKTRLQDFLEKYPNAPIAGDGTPELCPSDLGYCKYECNDDMQCIDCWSLPVDYINPEKGE